MSQEKQSEILDISAVLRQWKRKWYWFVISIVLCTLLGFLYSLTVKPQYEVRAQIMLSESSGAAGLMAGGLSGVSDLLGGNSNAEDEVEVATAHSVLREVVRNLNLQRKHYLKIMPLVKQLMVADYPVEVTPDPSINLDTLRTGLAFHVKVLPEGDANIKVIAKGEKILDQENVRIPAVVTTPYGRFTVAATKECPKGETVKSLVTISGYDDAAEDLREEVSVGLATKHSSIITFQMLTDNVRYGIDVLNDMIAQYNSRSHNDHVTTTSNTAKFLEGRLNLIRKQLDDTEANLAKYKEGEGITDLQTDGAVIYQRMTEAEKLLTEQQVLSSVSELTLQMVRESAKDNSLIPLQDNNPVISPLITAYNNLILRRNSMATSAKDDNPALLRLDDQISNVRGSIIETLQNDLAKSRDMEKEYKRLYEGARGSVTTLPKQEQSYRAIVRQQTIQEQIYIYLLQKQEETAILMTSVNPKGAIIDQAYAINEDTSTPKWAILLMAMFVGFCIPPVVIYLKSAFGKKKPADKETKE